MPRAVLAATSRPPSVRIAIHLGVDPPQTELPQSTDYMNPQILGLLAGSLGARCWSVVLQSDLSVHPSPATHAILTILEAGESVFQTRY